MAQFRLEAKQALTERISAFTLAPLCADAPTWKAGAHIDVDLGDLGTRSYSLIRWPDSTNEILQIAVQAEPDGTGGSQAMHALEVGTELTISHPKNSFELQNTEKPVALIAGGIGVTPLISMATQLLAENAPFGFHYTGRSRSVMAYVDELAETIGERLSVYTDDADPIDLSALLKGKSEQTVYICGPKGMIDAARNAASDAGIANDDIHVELFTTPDAQDGDVAFEVELGSTGEVVTVGAGVTIIEALEEAGHDVLYDCQRGDCGICQVDVLVGTPDHRDVVLSDDEKASGKVMQICVSRAKSARLVLDI